LDSALDAFASSQLRLSIPIEELWKYSPRKVWWSLVLNNIFPGRFILHQGGLKEMLHHNFPGNSQGRFKTSAEQSIR